MSYLQAIRAFWAHDLNEQLSYPLIMVQRLVSAATLLFLLYYGGQLVDAEVAQNQLQAPFFLYSLTGIATLQLLHACLSSFTIRVRRYQLTGLLEACLMTRTPLWQVLSAMPIFDLCFAFFRAALVLVLGFLVVGFEVSIGSIAIALLFAGLGVVLFLAVGLISSALTLVLKGGDPVGRVVQLASVTVAGTFIPRDVLPDWIALIGEFVPVAPVLDGARGALFEGAALTDLLDPLFRLVMLGGFLIPVAGLVGAWGLYRVLRDGSLAHY
ncbi:MAG: ABC-2 type transport system permease protein [Bradymonadia bacterium]|jgi:ABC-2 type transport system permease protein